MLVTGDSSSGSVVQPFMASYSGYSALQWHLLACWDYNNQKQSYLPRYSHARCFLDTAVLTFITTRRMEHPLFLILLVFNVLWVKLNYIAMTNVVTGQLLIAAEHLHKHSIQ